jgi:hypothetical protein
MQFTIHSKKYGDHTVIIDDEDAEKVMSHKWNVNYSNEKQRWQRIATRAGKNDNYKTISLHEMIIGYKHADHINRDIFDNRKINLRRASYEQNSINRGIQKNNTSGYKGVWWNGKINKWVAGIKFNHKNHHLGVFENKENAAIAYNKIAYKIFGEYAFLNKISKRKIIK